MSLSALLIAGPTASGKSSLALELARACNGILVNADSMQVYVDLQVISARPGAEEMALAPHRLFGHVDGAVNYSVGLWLQDAAAALDQARAQNRMPIFVGGTGMYFKALLQGLSQIPKVPEDLRAQVREEARGRAPQEMHARLAMLDPAMAARLRPSDPQRILRAIEVHLATGRSLSEFQALRPAPLLAADACLAVALAPARETVDAAIDARFDSMLAGGALAEAAALAARNLDPALPVMRALAVPHLLAHLAGDLALAAAAARSKADIRAYARRQETFLRHQLPEFRRATPEVARLVAFGQIGDGRAR